MSNRPAISWNSALRNLHADRIQVAPASAPLAPDRRHGPDPPRSLVTPTGAFDRAAIMAAAVEAAKAQQRRHGTTWAAAMSVGLTAAWASARAARSALAH